jgi:dTDP-4-dehydrorhamnose reductase
MSANGHPSPSAVVKTAVIGASGFVGRHLWQAYRRVYPDCLGTTFSASRPELAAFDIRRPELASLKLEEKGYGAVLIASAKPNIAYCEEHREEAYAVNVRGALELVRQVGRTSMQVIFISSDYVFEGMSGRYGDEATTRPTTEYGRQKALVERELPSLAPNYLILRLSKIFGLEKGDRTLLDEIAGRLVGGDEVRAATDQVFCPTSVHDLVRAILAIQARGLRGVLNVCSPERWSRYDVCRAVAGALKIDSGRVKPVSLGEVPGMAGRPLDTSMTCPRLALEVGASFVPLSDALRRVASNWRPGLN